MLFSSISKKSILSAMTIIVTSQIIFAGQAKALTCDTLQLARKAKLYNLQAKDARENAQVFQEIYSEAYKDVTRSQMILAASAFLLFSGELMLAAESGAVLAVPTRGLIGRLGYMHAQATEALAVRTAGMFSNEFLTVLPSFASTFVAHPHLLMLGASTYGGLQSGPEDDISKRDEFIGMAEKMILTHLEDRRLRQAQLLDKAPNQFLDGLSLGALDKKWTYQMWENAQASADLMENLAKIKSQQLTDCITKISTQTK